jgi:glycine cleavage system H protein
MKIPAELKYTEEHEWTRVEGDLVVIGITDYAQGELGDMVYVELPEEGDKFGANDVFGSVEAVKAAADLYCPISGEIVEVNTELTDTPEMVNQDAYGTGWMIKIRPDDPAELDGLLTADAYQQHIGK